MTGLTTSMNSFASTQTFVSHTTRGSIAYGNGERRDLVKCVIEISKDDSTGALQELSFRVCTLSDLCESSVYVPTIQRIEVYSGINLNPSSPNEQALPLEGGEFYNFIQQHGQQVKSSYSNGMVTSSARQNNSGESFKASLNINIDAQLSRPTAAAGSVIDYGALNSWHLTSHDQYTFSCEF